MFVFFIGIEVHTIDGKRKVKAHLMAASLDLPARALVSNMKQFNGKQACCICLDEGETSPGNTLHRFYPLKEDSIKRTKDSFKQDAIESATHEVTVGIEKLLLFFFPMMLVYIVCPYLFIGLAFCFHIYVKLC